MSLICKIATSWASDNGLASGWTFYPTIAGLDAGWMSFWASRPAIPEPKRGQIWRANGIFVDLSCFVPLLLNALDKAQKTTQ